MLVSLPKKRLVFKIIHPLYTILSVVLFASYLGREEDPAGDVPGGRGRCVGADVVAFPSALCPSAAALAPFVFFLSISRLTGSRSLMLGGFLDDPDFDAIARLCKLRPLTL